MCSVPPLGALNKQTREYVYPAIASKQDNYVCPECDKDLILRKGTIRVAHFAHCKDDNPCHYYSKPTEAQVHKDAKLLLKRLLESGQQLLFRRKCPHYSCPQAGKPEEYEIPAYSDSSRIVIEHRFDYNGPKIADVAYLDNKELVAIFEICNTHRTAETARPEPWFEVDAYTLINSVNSSDTHVKCIRQVLCDDCIPVKCHRCTKEVPIHKAILDRFGAWCEPCESACWHNIYLNVPYADKDAARRLGCKWDTYYKRWCISVSIAFTKGDLLPQFIPGLIWKEAEDLFKPVKGWCDLYNKWDKADSTICREILLHAAGRGPPPQAPPQADSDEDDYEYFGGGHE